MPNHAHNLRFDAQPNGIRRRGTAPQADAPLGVITRGTTGYNRLRRCDRWMRYHPAVQRLLRAPDRLHPPLALDVGYGASHTTTCEWARWLRQVRPDVRVIGLEINPERILPPRNGVRFELGGFELAGYRPQLVRAFNVLRQYDADQVQGAWREVTSRLAPGGFFIEGTCDELGRRASWVTLSRLGPAPSPWRGRRTTPRRPPPSQSGCPRCSSTATFPAKRSTTSSWPPIAPGIAPPLGARTAPESAGGTLCKRCRTPATR